MQERGKKERRELAVRKGLRPKLPTLKMEEESQKSRKRARSHGMQVASRIHKKKEQSLQKGKEALQTS